MTSARRAHGGGPDVGSVSSAQPQAVLGPATATVLVLVLTVRHGVDCCSRVRALCEDVGDLTRSVDSQDPHTGVSCVVGFGAQVWPRLFGLAAPDQLRPFAPIRGHRYDAPATPGDVFFHIRSDRADLCFELGTRILARLDGAVTAVLPAHKTPPPLAEALQDGIGGSRLVTLPGAGHLSCVEAPAGFAAALLGFLDERSLMGAR
jgi:pimeloyl-ACP methyl ester carboxylesterase